MLLVNIFNHCFSTGFLAFSFFWGGGVRIFFNEANKVLYLRKKTLHSKMKVYCQRRHLFAHLNSASTENKRTWAAPVDRHMLRSH